MSEKKEGWKYLSNSPKWHYFRGGRSLCRKWGTFSNNDLQQGNNDSPSNCKSCRAKLEKESNG